MQDLLRFLGYSLLYTNYRVVRSLFVLTFSFTAMALCFNPVSLILAGIVWGARVGAYRRQLAKESKANKESSYNESDDNLHSQKVQTHFGLPLEASFLPPILTNRIIGYDQLFYVESDNPDPDAAVYENNRFAFVTGHLKELFWLSVGVGTAIAAYKLLPVFAASLGLGILAAAGAAVGASFAGVNVLAWIGQGIRSLKTVEQFTDNSVNMKDTSTKALGVKTYTSLADHADRIKNNLNDTFTNDLTHLAPYTDPRDESDETFTPAHRVKLFFTGGRRLDPIERKEMRQITKNRL